VGKENRQNRPVPSEKGLALKGRKAGRSDEDGSLYGAVVSLSSRLQIGVGGSCRCVQIFFWAHGHGLGVFPFPSQEGEGETFFFLQCLF
jgi:hypothetical protein